MTRFIIGGALVPVLCVALLAQTGPSPQKASPQDLSPPVIFRAGVNYVEVDATVVDSSGTVVTDLGQDDFEVFEDGKPQVVSAFSRVSIPTERGERLPLSTTEVEPDVKSNEGGEGRIYFIVLDDLHILPEHNTRTRTVARQFVERYFGANDVATVVYTSGRASAGQDFTSSKHAILASIDRFMGEPPPEGGGADGASANNAKRTATTIKQLSEFGAGLRGRRKAMLLVSSGITYDITAVMPPLDLTSGGPRFGSDVNLDMFEAIAAATRANVRIYSVDPRGLDFDVSLGGGAERTRQLGVESLRSFAVNTGGFAAVGSNNFPRAFERIVEENSNYYLLGYDASNDRRDGKFRRVSVRVKRPGLRVIARGGYYEPRGDAPRDKPVVPTSMLPAVAAAMASPLAVGDVPLRVVASVFRGTSATATVAVTTEIDVTKLNLVHDDDRFKEKFEFSYAATNARGKVFSGKHHEVTLAMKPATLERAKAHRFRVLSQMDLLPGHYQLRVAAGNAAGKAGSVVYDLDVPDFTKAAISMSGVAITSDRADEAPTIETKNPLAGILPGPATAAREFTSDDTLDLFAEFYAGDAKTSHAFEMTAELQSDDGRVVQRTSSKESSATRRGNRGAGFSVKFPLNGVPAGRYVLRVAGTLLAGAHPTASRDIPIRVR